MASELIRRAGRVGGRVELRNIQLVRTYAEQLERSLPAATNLKVEIEVSPASELQEGQALVVRVRYVVIARVEETNDKVYQIDAEWLLAYQLREGISPSSEELEAFASVNGVFVAHPYERELVQRLSGQLGFPPLILATLRSPLEILAGEDYEVPIVDLDKLDPEQSTNK